MAIGYCAWQRYSVCTKRELPNRRRWVVHGESQPDLSRKIYSVDCHLFITLQKEVESIKSHKPKKEQKSSDGRTKWIITIFLLAMGISALFSFFSQELLGSASLGGAFAVLLVIISVGILFDVIGVAVTSADERPFHSMAARKVVGAPEAIDLLRSADRVSSVCNDVIGDICGIISGTAVTVIVGLVAAGKTASDTHSVFMQLMMSAFVAGLTIGGKAVFKTVAIHNSTAIVHTAAKTIAFFKRLFQRKHRK